MDILTIIGEALKLGNVVISAYVEARQGGASHADSIDKAIGMLARAKQVDRDVEDVLAGKS